MDETRHEDAEHAVGVVFRLTRRRLRLSQRELADLLGWDPSAVGRWESGHVSTALGRVDGVLRGMGFRLAVIPLDDVGPENWDEVDLPIEHIADRALRKFPAHLDHLHVEHRPFHWWLRYQDKPSPAAPDWTYRRRRSDRPAPLSEVAESEECVEEAECAGARDDDVGAVLGEGRPGVGEEREGPQRA